MGEIVTVVESRDRIGPVLDVASAYSELLGCELVVYADGRLVHDVGFAAYPAARTIRPLGRNRSDWVARTASRPEVQLVVLTATPVESGGWCADLLRDCPAPVLVVPDTMERFSPAGPTRVLAPLDGSAESTSAVTETMDLFAAAGAEIVVLHVFGQATAPAFWDQPIHARRSWGEEFLARHVRTPGIRIELRTGAPGEEVLAVAEAEEADLIALGWSRDLSPGRAQTVRNAVARARVPVLLVPLLRGTEAAPGLPHEEGSP